MRSRSRTGMMRSRYELGVRIGSPGGRGAVAGNKRRSAGSATPGRLGQARPDGLDEAVPDAGPAARVQGLVAQLHRTVGRSTKHEVARADARRVPDGNREPRLPR